MKMTQLSLITAGLLGLASASAMADRVGGAPKANFSTNELSIPCVQVSNLSDQTEGKYFDLVLVRRGTSYNYELTMAELEDSTVCERIAEFARFEDDDFSDDSNDADGNDDADDDNDSNDDSSSDGALPLRRAALAQCEVRTDRSKVSVKVRGVADGNYYAVVTSGANSVQSLVQASSGNEVEFDFDSDSDDVLAGAAEIESGFILDKAVTTEIFLEGDTVALLSAAASCRDKR